MMTFGLGIALVTPNPVALVGFVLLVVTIELQVRVVEEPYLLTMHGDAYRDYLASVGRFVPGGADALTSDTASVLGDLAFDLVQPDARRHVRRRPPVTARRQRSAVRHLRPLGIADRLNWRTSSTAARTPAASAESP